MSILSRLLRSSVTLTLGARSKARRLSAEPLEERALLAADLSGYLLNVTEQFGTPGETVTVSWGVWNTGDSAAVGPLASGFYVHFNLINSNNVASFLGSQYVEPLSAINTSSYSKFGVKQLSLPASNDAVWNGSGGYVLAMNVDVFNNISESNEGNNYNSSFLQDYDTLVITIPPDLRGQTLSIDNSTALVTGGQGTFSFQASNVSSGAAPATNAGLYLSRDAIITSTDRLLRSITIPALAGAQGYSAAGQSFQLPDTDDAFWDGASGDTYYVGVIYDSDGAVAETNETNNANLGQGIDVAQVTINRRIDLTKLPPTGFQPGALAKEFFYQERLYLQQVLADYRSFARTVGDPFDVRAALTKMIADVRYFENLLYRIGTGKTQAVQVGGGKVLDAAQVELMERGIIRLLSEVGTATASATLVTAMQLNPRDVVSTFDVDPRELLKQAQAQLRQMFDNLRRYGPPNFFAAGEYLLGAGALLGAGGLVNPALLPPAATVAAVGAGMIGIGALLQTGIRVIETFNLAAAEQIRRDVRQVTEANVFGSLLTLASQIATRSGVGKQLSKTLTDFNDAFFNSVGRAADDAVQNFSAYSGKARSAAFAGRWNGSNFDPGGSNKMSVTFNRNSGATPTGSVQFISRTFQGGALLKTERMTGTFSGRWTTDNKIEGNITIRNSRGQTVTLPFSWNYDGNSLSGSLYEGSGNFSVSK